MADGNEEAKIFVGGLSWETNEDKLRNYFSVFGDVTECLVMKNLATGKSRGFGFVTFADPNSVKKVLCIHNHQLDGRTIDPKECNPRTAAKARKDYKQLMSTSKIFLGGLPPNITETNLREFFSKYGNVTEAIIMFDQEKKKSRGFGFLSFDSDDSINKVVAEHYVNINGKQVEVKRAEPQLAKSGTPVPNGNIPHGANIPMPYYMQPWNMWTAAQMMSPPTPYGWNPTTAAAAAAAIAATAASQQTNWSYPGYPNWTALQSPFGPTTPIPFGPGAQNASGATNTPGLPHHHHHGPGPHGSAAAAAVAAAAAAAAASQSAPGAAAGFIPTPNNMAAALNLPNGSAPSLPSGMMPTALTTPGIGNYQHDSNNFGGSRPNGPYGQNPYNTHTSNNNGVATAMTGGWNSASPATFGNPNGTGSNGPSTGVQGTNAAGGGSNIQQVPSQSSQQPQNINDPMSSAYNQFHGSRAMVQNSGYHPYRRS